MRIKNSLSASKFEKKYQIFTMPSMTIPDQTMSIRTILDRYSRGLPIGGRVDEYYDEDDTLPDFRTLDLAERQELAIQYTEELNEVKSRKKNVSTNVDNNVDNSEGVIKTDETES